MKMFYTLFKYKSFLKVYLILSLFLIFNQSKAQVCSTNSDYTCQSFIVNSTTFPDDFFEGNIIVGNVGNGVSCNGDLDVLYLETSIDNQGEISSSCEIITEGLGAGSLYTVEIPLNATEIIIYACRFDGGTPNICDFDVNICEGITISEQPSTVNTCEGEDVNFTVSATGASNLSYQWQVDCGEGFINIGENSDNPTLNLTNITAADACFYQVQIRDENQCEAFSEIVSLNLGGLVINAGDDIVLDCTTTAYDFPAIENGVWTNENDEIVISTTDAATYTLTVTTPTGCTASDDLAITIDNETPTADAGGDTTISCGATNYNFQTVENGVWTNAAGEIITSTSEEGVFTLTVTNANGCSASDEIEIFFQGEFPIVEAGDDIVLDCITTAYDFPTIENGVWTNENDEIVISTTESGTYTLTVTTPTSCTASDLLMIMVDNTPPEVSAGGDLTLGCGVVNYMLPEVENGVWTNADGTEVGVISEPGVFILTVTGENGCTASDSKEIFVTENPMVDVGGDLTLGCGLSEYVFPEMDGGTWTDIDGNELTSTSEAGIYTLTVNQFGCSASDEIEIFFQGEFPIVEAGDDIVLDCITSAYDFPEIEGGIWTDATGEEVISSSMAGTYTLTITSENGCSASDDLIITLDNEIPTANAGSDLTLGCNVANYNFEQITNGVWTNAAGDIVTSTTAAGVFTLTVTSANGCSASDAFEIFVLNTPIVDAGEDVTLTCSDEIYIFPMVENGVWTNASGNELSETSTVGIYTLTVTDGCTASDNIAVSVAAEVMAGTISTTDATTVCIGGDETVTISVAGGMGANLAYVVTDGSGTTILAGPTTDTTFDFSEAPEGTCQIWAVWFDNIDIPDNQVANITGCFALSNPINIIRETCTDPCEAVVDVTESATICAGESYEASTGNIYTESSSEEITDADGCVYTLFVNITIVEVESFGQITIDICASDATSVNLLSYLPAVDNGNYIFLVDSPTSYDALAENEVSVIFENDFGCEATGLLIFNIEDCDVPPVNCENVIQCGFAEYCTEPMTEIVFCPEYCVEGVEYTDFVSFYNCSITPMADGCFTYAPLPGMETIGYDIVTLDGETPEGECVEYIVQINVGGCVEVCENPAMEVCVAPMTPEFICPEFCAFDENTDYAITNIQSIYHCSIWQNNDYCFRYIGIPGFVGQDVVEVTAMDANGNESVVVIYMNITDDCNANNTAPEAMNDEFSTYMNEEITIDILANDVDADGDDLTICSHEMPANGFIQLVNGVFIFTPDAGFTGITSFTYTICDGNGGSSSAIVLITVETFDCVNEPLALCTAPMTGFNFCPEFCHFDITAGNYEIVDVVSIYGCAVDIISNSCVAYIPLPGLDGATDVITVYAENADGVVSELEVQITVSDNCEDGARLGEEDVVCNETPDLFNPAEFGANDIVRTLNANNCYSNESYEVSIYNVNGQKVAQYEGEFGMDANTVFAPKGITTGSYYYQVTISNTDKILSGTIVIVK